MVHMNRNFLKLEGNYLFAEVANRVAAYKKANPEKDVISMGIGDVTQPIVPAVVEAARAACAELGQKETFHGYGPYEGYAFLREPVCAYYARRGVRLDPGEVFIGDGAKNDLGGILDLFGPGNTVLVPDPVYPAYVDVNVLTGNRIVYADGTEANGYLPAPPDFDADLLYLCSPNNPTGAVYTREGLKAWVDYARARGAVILFDAAYESFVGDPALPRSIFEIPGAETCAIELCSLSKTAGFTGVRCGYTVVPRALEREGMKLNELWARRAAVKYNGTSYIIQRAAAAVFTEEGQRQIRENIAYYKNNARVMAAALRSAGVPFIGGENSPYLWFRCPGGMPSWEVFDLLLEEANVVCTPGAGFGKNGEGNCRLTAFGDAGNTGRAMERVAAALAKLR